MQTKHADNHQPYDYRNMHLDKDVIIEEPLVAFGCPCTLK